MSLAGFMGDLGRNRIVGNRNGGGGLGGLLGDVARQVIPQIPGLIGGGFQGDDPMRPTLPVPSPGGVPMPTGPISVGAPPVFRGGCGPTPTGRMTRLSPRQLDNGKLVCPSGWHFSEKLGCCVKNRRMNPLNERARARATRRLLAFNRKVKQSEKALRGLAPPRRRAAPRRGSCKCK